MKKHFPGYYTPKSANFAEMWNKGIFIFDTNVLLDLYRYSEETSNELLKVIESIKDRIWIPYQVSKEYHKNLNSVISDQFKRYDESIKTLDQFKCQIEAKRNHPFLSIDLQKEITGFYLKIHDALVNKQKDMKSLLSENPIKEKLADLLENKIGDSFPEEQLSSIYSEAEKRYSNKIPPGYKDINKPIPEKYGDYIFWKEVLKKNCEISVPIILITGDTKEDWYYEELGLTIGPRPELIDEFNRVKPNLFYMYPTNQFLKYAVQHLKSEINNKSIIEIDESIKQGRKEEQTQAVSENNMATESTFTSSSNYDSTVISLSDNNNESTSNVP